LGAWASCLPPWLSWPFAFRPQVYREDIFLGCARASWGADARPC